ncbi:MAG: glycosyltransferase family 4 protein, partial [Treponema sp.]
KMHIYGIYLVEKIITGGNRRYIELLTSIAKRGVNVSVFANEPLKDEFVGCSVFPIPIKLKKGKRVSVQTAEQLKHFLEKNQHIFSKNTLDVKDSYILIFGETDWSSSNVLKIFSNAKIVFAYRSDIIEEIFSVFKYEKINIKKRILLTLKYLITRYREKLVSKNASFIIFQSENDERNFKLRNKKIKAKTLIIPNDILQARFKNEYKDKNESKTCNKFLFVGSYDIRKGLIFFLKALVIVKEANIPFTATVLVMGDELPSISAFIEQCGLEDSVKFVKNAKESFSFMIEHDVLIVPSLFDSFPNVIMEALHVGLPVFASNASGMPYMLQNEKLLFEVANPNSIAEKLISCSKNNDYYLEVRKLCKEERKKFEFDWAEKWIYDIDPSVTLK